MLFRFLEPNTKEDLQRRRTHIQRMAKAFVLVEVLLSMTVLAIAGTTLLRSIQNSINASRKARDTAKMVFLAKSKLHEYEMKYSFRPIADLGIFNGTFNQSGLRSFVWTAQVDYNRTHDAFMISVWVSNQPQSQNYRFRRSDPEGVRLVSMVPTARFNDFLVQGINPGSRRPEPRGSGGRR